MERRSDDDDEARRSERELLLALGERERERDAHNTRRAKEDSFALYTCVCVYICARICGARGLCLASHTTQRITRDDHNAVGERLNIKCENLSLRSILYSTFGLKQLFNKF